MTRIVFDLDGTLIDSAPDIHGIANALLAREGAAPISLAQARDFIGNGAAVFVRRMRAASAIPDSEQDRLHADFVARYDSAVTLTQPYPNVPEVLQTLRASGHRPGVCTNKPERAARAVLAHLDLLRHFDVLVGGDSTPTTKPDPAPLHASFAALGDGARVYVGDSEVDAETAQRAGVPFALYTEGYRKTPVEALPHKVSFTDFTALPGLVDTLLAPAA